MNISISTYQVKRGDTLESVAGQLGISAEALKRYHNTYCDLKSLIGNDLRGVHEILIPSPEKIAELKENQKQISLSNSLPSFHLNKNFYALNYEATERFEQLDKEDLVIDYSVSVKLQETEGKGFISEVKATEYKKNGEKPNDKISNLSLGCMESISPLTFIVPVQGKIKGFYDHKALIKKFESKRPDLEDFFIGEVSRTYLNNFHSGIKNENYLLKQFQSALLYQILFPEMDWFHRKKEWEQSFFVVPNSFSVKCLFHTEYNFENPYDVEIIIKGKIEESCSLQELLRRMKFEELPEDKVTGEIELRYTTSKETRQLKNIEASIILLHQEELYRKQSLLLRAKEENQVRKFSTLLD
ncbi:LysM peptidoglycan-binding domain-containing protein [Epilithonimonas caeni]|uniref:LysM peptidoglycan-binding domain-containing protein n=1 Tax=Epilithonimonas caeni TaxID=365343 RepID=UPI00041AE523|nr:LysM domain-containing protein [Epilithonimonas caeni]